MGGGCSSENTHAGGGGGFHGPLPVLQFVSSTGGASHEDFGTIYALSKENASALPQIQFRLLCISSSPHPPQGASSVTYGSTMKPGVALFNAIAPQHVHSTSASLNTLHSRKALDVRDYAEPFRVDVASKWLRDFLAQILIESNKAVEKFWSSLHNSPKLRAASQFQRMELHINGGAAKIVPIVSVPAGEASFVSISELGHLMIGLPDAIVSYLLLLAAVSYPPSHLITSSEKPYSLERNHRVDAIADSQLYSAHPVRSRPRDGSNHEARYSLPRDSNDADTNILHGRRIFDADPHFTGPEDGRALARRRFAGRYNAANSPGGMVEEVRSIRSSNGTLKTTAKIVTTVATTRESRFEDDDAYEEGTGEERKGAPQDQIIKFTVPQQHLVAANSQAKSGMQWTGDRVLTYLLDTVSLECRVDRSGTVIAMSFEIMFALAQRSSSFTGN